MSQRAKLFKSAGSQAARLPKEFRFEGEEEVLVYRQGDRVILEPLKRTWSRKLLDLAGSAPDFPYSEMADLHRLRLALQSQKVEYSDAQAIFNQAIAPLILG